MFAKLYNLLIERAVENQVELSSRQGLFLLYELLNESVEKHPHNAESQQGFLRFQLECMPKNKQERICQAMDEVRRLIYEDEMFKLFHWSFGGIISGSDDTLYMDFGSWFIGRGTQAMIEFLENGVQPMINYIKDNQIPDSEYEYESLTYAFYFE